MGLTMNIEIDGTEYESIKTLYKLLVTTPLSYYTDVLPLDEHKLFYKGRNILINELGLTIARFERDNDLD